MRFHHTLPFMTKQRCSSAAATSRQTAPEAPVSSEISDLLFFVSYFASQSKGIKFGDYFFDVYCVN